MATEKKWTSKRLNTAITALDEEDAPGGVPYFGWYWRDVDWDADCVSLAVTSATPPSWFSMTAGAMLGKPWTGRMVGFCENNKWGYHEFEVTGESWNQLRTMVRELVKAPSAEAAGALAAFLDTLAPADSEVVCP